MFDYGRSKRARAVRIQEELGLRAPAAALRVPASTRDSIPQNNPANAKYRLLIETWRRMPIGLANWLGPKVVRSLG